MRYNRTVALGMVLLLLAGYVYFFEMQKTGQKDEDGTGSPVLPMAMEEIGSFSLSDAEQTVRCVRDSGDVWWLTEPVRTEGSKRDIERFLLSLQEARVIRTVADSAAALADYGLDRPRLSIGVGHKAHQDEQTLLLGRSNPTGSYIYAKRGDRPVVFLVSAALLPGLEKKPYDLRLKKVLDFKPGDIRSMALRRGGQTVVCTRHLDSWRLEVPMEVRADRGAVEHVLQVLSDAVAREFVAERIEDGRQYGFDRPTVAVDLSIGEGDTTRQLVIGRRAGGRYYARDLSRQSVFTVDSALVSSLSVPAADMRDRSVMAVAARAVRQIGWQTDQGTLLFRRDHSGAWEMVRPFRARADGLVLNDLLDKLEHLSAKTFVTDSPADLEPYGLACPRGRIEVMMEGDSTACTLAFGGNHDGQIYVQNSMVPSVYLVDASFFDLVRKDAACFRDRRILDFFADGVREMEIGYDGGTYSATKDSKGRWKIPYGRNPAAGDMADLLSSLHELRCESFVDDQPADLSVYGLKEPRYTVTLRLEGKDPEVLMVGGERKAGLVYVTCARTGSVFLARDDVVKHIEATVTGDNRGR